MNKAFGLILSISIAAISYGLSLLNPLFDPLAMGIIIGIIVSNLLEKHEHIEAGADFCIKLFLPIGIALYGFRLKFHGFLTMYEVAGLFAVFAGIFLITMLVSLMLKLNTNVSILLSTGLTVCGASAITVISPAIHAKKRETSISILAVMTAGLMYTILYPAVGDMLSLSKDVYAFLAGSTLPMVGQVKVSTSHFGNDVVAYALSLKSLRIASLIFMVTITAVFSGIREKRLKVPWFMIVFAAFATIANVIDLHKGAERAISQLSSISLTIALSAIGLHTSLDSIVEFEFKPFIAAILSVMTIVLILYGVYIL